MHLDTSFLRQNSLCMSIIINADLEGSMIAVFRDPNMFLILLGLVTFMTVDLVRSYIPSETFQLHST